MDYVHARRVKLWGNARVVEANETLQQRLSDQDYPGKVERAILFEIAAWDINCPQHIHKRLPADAVADELELLRQRVAQLEAELATEDRE